MSQLIGFQNNIIFHEVSRSRCILKSSATPFVDIISTQKEKKYLSFKFKVCFIFGSNYTIEVLRWRKELHRATVHRKYKKQVPYGAHEEKVRTGKAALNSDAQGIKRGVAARERPHKPPFPGLPSIPWCLPPPRSSVESRPVDCCGPHESWARTHTPLSSCLLINTRIKICHNYGPNTVLQIFPSSPSLVMRGSAERCIKIF